MVITQRRGEDFRGTGSVVVDEHNEWRRCIQRGSFDCYSLNSSLRVAFFQHRSRGEKRTRSGYRLIEKTTGVISKVEQHRCGSSSHSSADYGVKLAGCSHAKGMDSYIGNRRPWDHCPADGGDVERLPPQCHRVRSGASCRCYCHGDSGALGTANQLGNIGDSHALYRAVVYREDRIT